MNRSEAIAYLELHVLIPYSFNSPLPFMFSKGSTGSSIGSISEQGEGLTRIIFVGEGIEVRVDMLTEIHRRSHHKAYRSFSYFHILC